MKAVKITWIFISILILFIALSFIIPVITGSTQLLIVLSGSMHPVMRVGDMVMVNAISPEELNVGDVIAYKDPGGTPNVLITHRIFSITEGEERLFQTKGDANEEEDSYQVPASKVVGEMVFVIPFAGYLPETTKNTKLFVLMVIVPAVLLIMDEFRKIILYSNPIHVRKLEKNQRKNPRVPTHVIRSRRIIYIALISTLVLTAFMLPTLKVSEQTTITSEEEYILQNNAIFDSVFVITPDDMSQRYSIEPWYTVITPGNETSIITNEDVQIEIAAVPYVLPVFWIIKFAEIHQYMPEVAIISIFTALFLVILFPLWYQKSTHRIHKKRSTFRQKLSHWLRAVQYS